MGPPLEIKLNMCLSSQKSRSRKATGSHNSQDPSLSCPSKTSVKHVQAGLLALPIPLFAFPSSSGGTVAFVPDQRSCQGERFSLPFTE